jgi:hypothetical protein
MKLLLDYIRSWFMNRPVAETAKEEENYYLIN